MLTFLSLFSLAQLPIPLSTAPVNQSPAALNSAPLVAPAAPAAPATPSRDVLRRQSVRSLPGRLDEVPVFNSNSPELIQRDGILLSTFPKDGMQVPTAHLNFPFQGRFDIFAHHVVRGINPNDDRTVFLGILVFNPGTTPVKIDVLQAVSYLSQEAPFNELPSYVANPVGAVFSGPGSRATADLLRQQRQSQWPNQITIPPRHSYMLMNVPIPLRRLSVATDGTLPPGYLIPPANPLTASVASSNNTGVGSAIAAPISAPPAAIPGDNRPLPMNGRTAVMQLSSNGPVYVASMGMYAPKTPTGAERVPNIQEWERLLIANGLSGPRDRTPTPPDARSYLRFFYGRVSGVARGSQWTANAHDGNTDHLIIPKPGEAFSYVISTVDHNTFGTRQVQSAPLVARYPDTAYRAHGNYGIRYSLTMPLYNNTDSSQTVSIHLETPLQDENLGSDGLRFLNPPENQIFFRGTVRLRYKNDLGIPQTRDIHVVQRRGEEGEPLVRLTLPRGARRNVEVQLVYPPDATPPQVITVKTDDSNAVAERSTP